MNVQANASTNSQISGPAPITTWLLVPRTTTSSTATPRTKSAGGSALKPRSNVAGGRLRTTSSPATDLNSVAGFRRGIGLDLLRSRRYLRAVRLSRLWVPRLAARIGPQRRRQCTGAGFTPAPVRFLRSTTRSELAGEQAAARSARSLAVVSEIVETLYTPGAARHRAMTRRIAGPRCAVPSRIGPCSLLGDPMPRSK